MSPTTIVTPLYANDLPELESWWQIGVPFVQEPNSAWLSYVLEHENVHVFCMRQSQDELSLLAYAHFDLEDGDAWVAIVTHPKKTQRGFGLQLIEESAARLRQLGVQRIVAAMESYNEASIRFFECAGFKEIPEDQDSGRDEGFVYLALSLESVGNTT